MSQLWRVGIECGFSHELFYMELILFNDIQLRENSSSSKVVEEEGSGRRR